MRPLYICVVLFCAGIFSLPVSAQCAKDCQIQDLVRKFFGHKKVRYNHPNADGFGGNVEVFNSPQSTITWSCEPTDNKCKGLQIYFKHGNPCAESSPLGDGSTKAVTCTVKAAIGNAWDQCLKTGAPKCFPYKSVIKHDNDNVEDDPEVVVDDIIVNGKPGQYVKTRKKRH